MRRSLALAVIIIILVGLFHFTRPEDSYLKSQAMAHVSSHVNTVAMPAGMQEIIKQNIEVEENFLYKTVTYNRAGTKKAIGYGFLGMFSGKDLKDVL